MKTSLVLAATLLLTFANAGCVLPHSRQALTSNIDELPAPKARFIQEEDSGLVLLGFLQLAEPDHYAVLLTRLRDRHKCKRLSFAQLDYYTDHWLVIAFPIARITALCEPGETGEK